VGSVTAPLRSRAESFPYYAVGGLLYAAGAFLVLWGVDGGLAEALEVLLLLAGSLVVAVAYLVDRGTIRPPI
jgi:hypothetical protein